MLGEYPEGKPMTAPKRLIAVTIAVVGLLVAAVSFGTSALAYPGGRASLMVSTQSPAEGGQLTVSGTGAAPNETLTLTLDTGAVLGTTTADSTGAFSTTVTLPSGVTGHHIITVSGSAGYLGTEAVDIQASGGGGSGGGGGGLAGTGVAVIGIGALGVVLLVGGALMLMAGRRRRITS